MKYMTCSEDLPWSSILFNIYMQHVFAIVKLGHASRTAKDTVHEFLCSKDDLDLDSCYILLSGFWTQAIHHHWYSMAPRFILLLSTSHPERKLLATKTTNHHFIAHMEMTTLTSTSWHIITIHDYPWLSEWCSSRPNHLLADSAMAGTKRLKPCSCFTVWSWTVDNTREWYSMIQSNVKYTMMSILSITSCETYWNKHSKTTLG